MDKALYKLDDCFTEKDRRDGPIWRVVNITYSPIEPVYTLSSNFNVMIQYGEAALTELYYKTKN